VKYAQSFQGLLQTGLMIKYIEPESEEEVAWGWCSLFLRAFAVKGILKLLTAKVAKKNECSPRGRRSGSFLQLGPPKAGGGDLQGVEHQPGGFAVELAGGEQLHDFGEGELDGV